MTFLSFYFEKQGFLHVKFLLTSANIKVLIYV